MTKLEFYALSNILFVYYLRFKLKFGDDGSILNKYYQTDDQYDI